MSISKPQTRDEMRQYILTKLGAPVIEINVAEEQIDIAIDDAFQFFNERSHFLGTENMYLTTRITPEFVAAFSSFRTEEVSQVGKNPDVPIPGRPAAHAEGMVEELTLITPGEGYPTSGMPLINITTSEETDINITTGSDEDIETQSGSEIIYQTNVEDYSTGQSRTVTIG